MFLFFLFSFLTRVRIPFPAQQDRIRPVSVCDTSWSRMTGQELRQQHLVRTPSQANNLCTTVPQNLVVQNLGGRHTPTRSSLRHSRMIVLSKNGKGKHEPAHIHLEQGWWGELFLIFFLLCRINLCFVISFLFLL